MKYSIILFLLLNIVACNKVNMQFQRSGSVNAVEHENSIIVLSSLAQAENSDKAIYFAERNAFENLLFKGIPNTNQESPMVPNENNAMNGNATFFKNLLNNQDYKRFVMDSYTKSNSRSNGLDYVEQIVKIDLRAFRSYLQSEGITKKFGL